jgi:hypothetical protein
MRFELTVGVDPLQRFSKPMGCRGEWAKTLEFPREVVREMRERAANTRTPLTQTVTQ